MGSMGPLHHPPPLSSSVGTYPFEHGSRPSFAAAYCAIHVRLKGRGLVALPRRLILFV